MLNYRDPDWLANAKAIAGLSTGQLAKAAGLSRSTVQRLANGDDPTLTTFRKIEDVVIASVSKRAAA